MLFLKLVHDNPYLHAHIWKVWCSCTALLKKNCFLINDIFQTMRFHYKICKNVMLTLLINWSSNSLKTEQQLAFTLKTIYFFKKAFLLLQVFLSDKDAYRGRKILLMSFAENCCTTKYVNVRQLLPK